MKINPFYVNPENRIVKHLAWLGVSHAQKEKFCIHRVYIDSRVQQPTDILTGWIEENLSAPWYYTYTSRYDSKTDEDYEVWDFRFEEPGDALYFNLRWGGKYQIKDAESNAQV